MTVRWVDPSSDATEFERELLELGRVDVPEEMENRVWKSILGALPPIVGPGDGGGTQGGDSGLGSGGDVGSIGAGGGAGASAATAGGGMIGAGSTMAVVSSLAVAKAFAVGVASGVTVLTAYSVVSSDDQRSRSVEVVPAVVPMASSTTGPRPALTGQPRHGGPSPATVGVGPPSPGSTDIEDEMVPESPRSPPTAAFDDLPGEPTPGDRASVLEEEARLVSQARLALRRGDFGRASALLEAARTRFPSGALAQEREVLAIEVLARAGNPEAARDRAAMFLRLNPSSPHASRMRELVGEGVR